MSIYIARIWLSGDSLMPNGILLLMISVAVLSDGFSVWLFNFIASTFDLNMIRHKFNCYFIVHWWLYFLWLTLLSQVLLLGLIYPIAFAAAAAVAQDDQAAEASQTSGQVAQQRLDFLGLGHKLIDHHHHHDHIIVDHHHHHEDHDEGKRYNFVLRERLCSCL